jgi:putative transposase
MARIPRIDLPGIAQHIVQRGNDRQACFADDADYLHYRQELGVAALKHACMLHAYVLMTNHVHVFVTPQQPGASSWMMQAIGRRYVSAASTPAIDALAPCGKAASSRPWWTASDTSSPVTVTSNSTLYALAWQGLPSTTAGRATATTHAAWTSLGSTRIRLTQRLVPPRRNDRRLSSLYSTKAYPTMTQTHCAWQPTSKKTWGSEWFRLQIEALAKPEPEVRSRRRPKLKEKCT